MIKQIYTNCVCCKMDFSVDNIKDIDISIPRNWIYVCAQIYCSIWNVYPE